jgi:FkbM family methyltransferase
MAPISRRLANSLARSLRTVRRALFPGMDTRRFALGRAYGRLVFRAARLDYVDGVLGHRMYLDDQDSLRLSVSRILEPTETHLVQRMVRAGDTTLDIGANIGYYTLLFARHVGSTGRVYAFEPEAENFSILQKNVATNDYANVIMENRAVWNTTTTLSLFLSEENKGDHRAFGTDDGRRAVRVDAVRLDDYFAEIPGPVHVVKMDIQGAEYHALEGMTSLLRRSPEAILFTEFWPRGLTQAGASPLAYLQLLQDLGFALYEIQDDADRVHPVDVQRLLDRYTPESEDFTNLLCTRRPL